MDGYEYLFDLETDERERANVAHRRPEKLAALRVQWEQWAESLPGIPDDAKVSVLARPQDMPVSSGC
jgi:hypothetical protein